MMVLSGNWVGALLLVYWTFGWLGAGIVWHWRATVPYLGAPGKVPSWPASLPLALLAGMLWPVTLLLVLGGMRSPGWHPGKDVEP